MTLRPLLVLAALAAACGPSKPPTLADAGIPAFRGLLATPRQLAFTCVVPGCDTSLTLKVHSNVNRRIAIKRIVLSEANAEYTLTPSEAPPFILGAASDFSVDVRLLPATAPVSGRLDLLITYTDASAEESADRVEANELVVPLVKRLVGEPRLAATPVRLDFGVVPVTQQKALPVILSNAGFGNIALQVDRVDAGAADLHVTLPVGLALVPDAGVELPFVFAPQTEQYLQTEVVLASSAPGIEPLSVAVEGTSHTWPRVALEPEERTLDFGDVPRGQRRKATVRVANIGGAALAITSLSATDPSGRLRVAFPGGMTTATLAPLERLALEVEVDGATPGPLDVPLVVASNDPLRPTLTLPIRATVTEPKLATTPDTLAWGTVPMGWVVARPVELKNVGWGPLTLKRIGFVGGTSTLYGLKNLPALPMTLERDARVAFEVEFRSETAASFMGGVSIETDDPVTPFSEVALSAAGGTCAAGCPIANGTPSCSTGACSVGACDSGWHDANASASDGCECREVGVDPGGFCSQGVNKGTLSDDGSSSNHTGLIHAPTDEDWILFFGKDESQVFGEDYDVRISLTSADPDISMCVSRHDTASSTTDCFPDSNKVCGLRSFRRDGNYGSEDGAMYYVKVYRTGAAAASCTPYTVYMTNG